MQEYRHKKFDVQRSVVPKTEIPAVKEELRTSTPFSTFSSYLEEEDSTSRCSSDYLPLPKRRRLDSFNESETQSLSSISADTLRDICKYHGNMVRKFPKKERSPKDQERRNKNTIACRMSRRVKKLEHLAIEEQYKEFTSQHLKIVEQSMRATAYLNHLNQLTKLEKDESKSTPNNPMAMPVKNFSIDYLISGMKQQQC